MRGAYMGGAYTGGAYTGGAYKGSGAYNGGAALDVTTMGRVITGADVTMVVLVIGGAATTDGVTCTGRYGPGSLES